MVKPLSEMTLAELWQLFPIVLKEYNPEYINWYSEEKEKLLNGLNGMKIARISHIGSTAVPQLVSKPTVDILLEAATGANWTELKRRLMNLGWILMSYEYKPEIKLAFNKGYTPYGFAEKVFHLHVRNYADWGELYFRDYLIIHKDVADEYGKLKLSLWKQYEHDRDGYTAAKTQFVKKYTQLAKMELENKYMPEI